MVLSIGPMGMVVSHLLSDTCDLLSLIQLSHVQYEYTPDWSSLSFFAVTFSSKDSKEEASWTLVRMKSPAPRVRCTMFQKTL